MNIVPRADAPRANEELYRSLSELATEAMYLADRDGQFVEVNPAGCEILGYACEELLEMTLSDLVRPEEQPRLRALWQRLSTGKSLREEWALRGRDGRYRLLELRMRVTPTGHWLAVGRDLSQGTTAETMLRESEQRLRLAQRAGRTGVFEWSIPDGRVVWSPELEALYQVPEGAFEGDMTSWVRRVVEEDAEKVLRGIDACLRERQTDYSYEFRAVLPDGTQRWLAGQAQFFFDSEGRPLRMIGVNVDIDDRKRGELRNAFLVELATAVRPLAEPDKLVETVARTVGEYLNVDRCAYADVEEDQDTFNLMGNYTRGLPSIVGRYRLADFGAEVLRLHRENKPYVVNDVETDTAAGSDLTAYRQTGIRAVIAVPVHKGGRFVAGIAVHQREPRKWTTQEVELLQIAANWCWESIERLRVARDLHASERRLRLALTSARMVAWEVDPSTGKAIVTENAAEMFGLAPGVSLESTEHGFALMHPEDAPRHREEFAKAMKDCGSFVTQFRMLRQDNGAEIWVEERAYSVCDSGGKTTRIVGIMLDITERRQAEAQLREAHALLSDKATHLEALVQQRTAKLRETIGELEAFSYSVAHDLRAPLRSLQGFSEVLVEEYAASLDATGQSYLRRIAKSAGRMDQLIQDVLNYSRVVRADLSLEKVDVEQLLHGIVETYPNLAPEKAKVVLKGTFPPVLGNEALMTQIFSNLLGNAVKFVAPGVKPEIEIWAEPRGSRVQIFVRDNGIGIPPDQHEKVFGMFEQLNRSYEGTGIGLAIVKKAVGRMNGRVGVTSEVGRGSIFWVDVQRG